MQPVNNFSQILIYTPYNLHDWIFGMKLAGDKDIINSAQFLISTDQTKQALIAFYNFWGRSNLAMAVNGREGRN